MNLHISYQNNRHLLDANNIKRVEKKEMGFHTSRLMQFAW